MLSRRERESIERIRNVILTVSGVGIFILFMWILNWVMVCGL